MSEALIARPVAAAKDGVGLAVVTAGLTKHFGEREAVSDLSLSVPAGRAFGLLGPNGSGKTTTVRLLTGLLTPSRGSVTLFGEPLTRVNADALRSRIGVQTDTNLYEALSVRENLRTWGELYGLGRHTVRRRTEEVLNVLGLSERVDSLVGELSKGMRQKLAVGRAVLHEPELLFLDEPTAGLDPEASGDLISFLKEMIRTLHTTVIICTHQLHGLESLCDDVGILEDGHLIVTGDVQQLLQERWPEHRYLLSVDGDPTTAREIIVAAIDRPVQIDRTDGRLHLAATDENAISAAVAALVHHNIQVRAVVPVQSTIQDLYFATINDRGPR